MLGLDRLRQALGGEDEEEEYISTFEDLERAPAWTHFGVGHKQMIPSVVPAMIANVYYTFVIMALLFGFAKLIWQSFPWVFAGSAMGLVLFIYHISSKYGSLPVRRMAVWWGGGSGTGGLKVLLWEALLDEDASSTKSFDRIHSLAERFASEAETPIPEPSRQGDV